MITGWVTGDGEVKSVSVDGDKEYSPDDWYPNDGEVVITYHTFPGEKKSDTKSNGENNTEKTDTEKSSTERSIYEKVYSVRFQDYDICYLK